MTIDPSPLDSSSKQEPATANPRGRTGASSTGPDDLKPSDPKPVSELTPEEQMERFAEDLKENDWGHQPC